MCEWFEYSSVIQGNHITKVSYTAIIGKTLQSQRELNNNYDSFAVAIIKNNTIVEPPY